MAIELKIYDPEDSIRWVRWDVPDEVTARRQAQERGYTVLAVRRSRLTLRKASRFHVQLFGQELLGLINAGMSMVEAIGILGNKARDGVTRHVLQQLAGLLQQGHTLSAALTQAGDQFPVLFTATVKASEQTGDLPQALHRYLAYQQQLNGVRDKIIAAAIYPLLLLVTGGLVVLFLMIYVVPRFGKVYADLGAERIPAMSRLLMHWGQLVNEHGAGLLGGASAVLALLGYALSRPGLRAVLQRLIWRLPRLGQQIRTFHLARFTRTVAMLLRGGVPLVAALDMTGELLRQTGMRMALQAARKAISEGAPLADSFAQHGLATDVGVRLLIVGERSGDLGATMERIAAYYDEEIGREVEWFSRIFEPVLMAAIGCLIGGIVVLMYLPIFELAGSIQ